MCHVEGFPPTRFQARGGALVEIVGAVAGDCGEVRIDTNREPGVVVIDVYSGEQRLTVHPTITVESLF